MTDKNLLVNGVHLVVKEAKFDCFMAKDHEKNTKETAAVAFGFSKYISSFEDLIDNVDFETFLDDVFSEVNNYLVGAQDYNDTINNILQQKRTFTKKFLA